MKLLTPEIIRALPSLYTTEAVRLQDKIVICKFFIPWTNWTWFVFEGEKQTDGDYLFFGMVHGFEKECGNFLLSELIAVRGPAGLRIERDLSVFKRPYQDLRRGYE